jgi:hypothetical protein
VGRSEGKNHLEVLGIDGRMLLNWIFKKLVAETWIGFIQLRIGQVAGAYETGNEHPGCIICGEFLD